MKLKTVVLRNFRSYRDETRIDLDDLTAFIGRNDAGKSSVLEALEVFFNSEAVKIEQTDACVRTADEEVVIGCVFTDLPSEIVLDASSGTSLAEEHLLNADGALEIHKVYNCANKAITPSIYAMAIHPTAEGAGDLLQLKHTDLNTRLKELGADTTGVDERANPPLRRAIWDHVADLQLNPVRVALAKEDGKAVWEQLQKALPIFALFRADRPSRDDDGEVQDPMRVAVQEAIRSVSGQLEAIKTSVQEAAERVAQATLEKLNTMDAGLATTLAPRFKDEPKWATLFKLSLTGDEDIPINKRGSGVRRLILLSFFMAEAERRQTEGASPGVVYAIEEPETSQHPHNQRALLESLTTLARQDGCQVIITTHAPGLTGYLPVEGIRYVSKSEDGCSLVRSATDGLLAEVAEDLGVLPDNRVRVFLCVEGPNDVAFLEHVSKQLHQRDPSLPDLSDDPRVAWVPLGGSTLRQWAGRHYLAELRRPEIHIYDRDDGPEAKYEGECQKINARSDDSRAFVTSKREIENYLHPDAIREALGVSIAVTDQSDVPQDTARALHEQDPASRPWDALDDGVKGKKEGNAKRRLNREAARLMTPERLRERDADDEVIGWLRAVAELAKP